MRERFHIEEDDDGSLHIRSVADGWTMPVPATLAHTLRERAKPVPTTEPGPRAERVAFAPGAEQRRPFHEDLGGLGIGSSPTGPTDDDDAGPTSRRSGAGAPSKKGRT